MRRPIQLALASVLTASLAACSTATEETPLDPCEQAAFHRESCGGLYVTPPVCDEDSEAVARWLLDLDCATLLKIEQSEVGKADGPFCIWFGAGCVVDEPIFTGSSCQVHTDCSPGAHCVESHCFDGLGSEMFEEIMDDLTDSRADSGSAMLVLDDNDEALAVRLELIERASDSIHMSALYMKDDASGLLLLDALVAATLRGVEVRVVLDDFGQNHWATRQVLEEMQSAGVEVLGYNPLTGWSYLRWLIDLWADQRLHEKILVVDGAHAVLGGRNISDDYFVTGKYRDTDVYVSGPGALGAQRVFLDVWDRIGQWERRAGCPQQLHCPLADAPSRLEDLRYFPDLSEQGTVCTRIIYSDPHGQDVADGYQAIIGIVRAARESIYMSNAYPVPPRRLRSHLRAAAQRGVDVVFITNSKTSSAEPFMYYAGINYYKEMIDAGIEIRHWRGPGGLHAKTMVVDGELGMVSSFNMDARSAARHTEAVMLIRDDHAVGVLLDAFEQDLDNTDIARYEDIPASDWAIAKLHRIVEPFL